MAEVPGCRLQKPVPSTQCPAAPTVASAQTAARPMGCPCHHHCPPHLDKAPAASFQGWRQAAEARACHFGQRPLLCWTAACCQMPHGRGWRLGEPARHQALEAAGEHAPAAVYASIAHGRPETVGNWRCCHPRQPPLMPLLLLLLLGGSHLHSCSYNCQSLAQPLSGCPPLNWLQLLRASQTPPAGQLPGWPV